MRGLSWLSVMAALLLGACLFDGGIDDCKNYPDPTCSGTGGAGTGGSGTGGTGGGP